MPIPTMFDVKFVRCENLENVISYQNLVVS